MNDALILATIAFVLSVVNLLFIYIEHLTKHDNE